MKSTGRWHRSCILGGHSMTKSELILRIGKLNPHFDHRDVERIVATIFDEIALRKADLERPT